MKPTRTAARRARPDRRETLLIDALLDPLRPLLLLIAYVVFLAGVFLSALLGAGLAMSAAEETGAAPAPLSLVDVGAGSRHFPAPEDEFDVPMPTLRPG